MTRVPDKTSDAEDLLSILNEIRAHRSVGVLRVYRPRFSLFDIVARRKRFGRHTLDDRDLLRIVPTTLGDVV